MILPERLYRFLKEQGIDFFTGVPDSLLKHFLKYLQDHSSANEHIIAANEGLAIGLASGYHFRSGKIPLVYLQNSGLGNIINPLTSLADKEMYAVPMLLMIGWRGRPGVKDEPQHIKMGRITLAMLEVLEIPYYMLDADETSSFKKIDEAIGMALKERKPIALVVPGDIFEVYEGVTERDEYSLTREHVIKTIIGKLEGNETVVCTTGKTGREFFEQNEAAGRKIKKYLLSVGAMGHANHIALGLKIQSEEKVVMLDGDGALLMQMGSLPTVAHHVKDNFIHIVINNGSHESVGGQPTEGFFADCCAIAKASGYTSVTCITNEKELNDWLNNGLRSASLQFVEIRVNKNSRSDLGRPAGEPVDWKQNLMHALNVSVAQYVIEGENSIGQMGAAITEKGYQSVFLITGKHFQLQDHPGLLEGLSVTHFIKSGPNVEEEELQKAFNEFSVDPGRAIVAIGGGSVMDLAKAVIYRGIEASKPVPFFIAVPTTAGSGSEATHFAVVYKNKKKFSLIHPALLPRYVILDPALTYSLSSYQMAVCGMDAFSQAVESCWNKNATIESKHMAYGSIFWWKKSFLQAVNSDPEARRKMLLASHMAGKAINITKTTGPHALSYYLTIHHGIPHGQAVALFIPIFFLYNQPAKSYCGIVDANDEYEAMQMIRQTMKRAGLATQFSELGLNKEEILDLLLDAVNEERFDNNPVAFDREKLKQLIREYL